MQRLLALLACTHPLTVVAALAILACLMFVIALAIMTIVVGVWIAAVVAIVRSIADVCDASADSDATGFFPAPLRRTETAAVSATQPGCRLLPEVPADPTWSRDRACERVGERLLVEQPRLLLGHDERGRGEIVSASWLDTLPTEHVAAVEQYIVEMTPRELTAATSADCLTPPMAAMPPVRSGTGKADPDRAAKLIRARALVEREQLSVRAAARRAGLPRSTLRTWLMTHREPDAAALSH